MVVRYAELSFLGLKPADPAHPFASSSEMLS